MKFEIVCQLFKFGMVGLSNAIISLLIYYALVLLHINYLIATIAGYFLSSLWGYILNKFWVFSAKELSIKKSMIKYYIVYGVSLLLSIGLAYIWVDCLRISKFISPILSMMITIPFNFLMGKFWIYRQ